MGPLGTRLQVAGARALPLALILAFVACAEESDGGDDSVGIDPTPPNTNYVVKTVIADTCLPRPLAGENGGAVPCQMIEAKPPSGAQCSPCDASTGRSEVLSGLRNAIEDELQAKGLCGGDTGIKCSSHCLCEIEQLSGAELDTCLNSVEDPGGTYGYCYVDPNNGFGNPDLVAACPDTQRQIIRFLGENVPSPGATTFVACGGS
jgi:hypothetical protein